jgi:hypothetical protein
MLLNSIEEPLMDAARGEIELLFERASGGAGPRAPCICLEAFEASCLSPGRALLALPLQQLA